MPWGTQSGRAGIHVSITLPPYQAASHTFMLLVLCCHPAAPSVWRCAGDSPPTAGGAICQSLSAAAASSPQPPPSRAHLSRASGLTQRLLGKDTDSCLSIRKPLSVHPHSDPEPASPVMCESLQPCSQPADSESSLLTHWRTAASSAACPELPLRRQPPPSQPTAFSTASHTAHLASGLQSQCQLAQRRVKKGGRDQDNQWGLSWHILTQDGGSFLMCSKGNEAGEAALPSSWHQHASYSRTVFIRKDTYWESHLCPSRGSVCPLWPGRLGEVWSGKASPRRWH